MTNAKQTRYASDLNANSSQNIAGVFRPAWWLPGGHLQTLWPALLRRDAAPMLRRERVELPDGDFIDVDWAGERGPIVVVLHGLGGSSDSHYARGILRAVVRQGWRGAVMHFRVHPDRLRSHLFNQRDKF